MKKKYIYIYISFKVLLLLHITWEINKYIYIRDNLLENIMKIFCFLGKKILHEKLVFSTGYKKNIVNNIYPYIYLYIYKYVDINSHEINFLFINNKM